MRLSSRKITALLKNIRLLILDVDGVLTNGRMYSSAEGEFFKAFFVRDGLGIVLLSEANVEVAVISGRDSPITSARCLELGIQHVYQGSLNKKTALTDLLAKLGLDASEVAFMGDDIIDIPIFQKVGFCAAPKDAHPDILKYLHWQSKFKGGKGAIRELADLILSAKGAREVILQRLRTDGDIYRKGYQATC